MTEEGPAPSTGGGFSLAGVSAPVAEEAESTAAKPAPSAAAIGAAEAARILGASAPTQAVVEDSSSAPASPLLSERVRARASAAAEATKTAAKKAAKNIVVVLAVTTACACLFLAGVFTAAFLGKAVEQNSIATEAVESREAALVAAQEARESAASMAEALAIEKAKPWWKRLGKWW